MFGTKTRPKRLSREEKRHAVFAGRYNAAVGPAEKLRIATDYIRTVARDMDPAAGERIAFDVFNFAKTADGIRDSQ